MKKTPDPQDSALDNVSHGLRTKILALRKKDPSALRKQLYDDWQEALRHEQQCYKKLNDYDRQYDQLWQDWQAKIQALQAECNSIHDLDALLDLMRLSD